MPATMLFCGFMRASFARLAGEGRTKFNSHTRGLLSPAPNDRSAPRPGPYTYVGIKLQCVSGLARRLPLDTIFMHFGGPKGHIYTLRPCSEIAARETRSLYGRGSEAKAARDTSAVEAERNEKFVAAVGALGLIAVGANRQWF